MISPMLSNVYLHHVLDEWFEKVAKPRLHGRCQLVRFVDDFVIAFEDRHSGKRMLDVLGKRLGRYGLTFHETKTRYVDFRRLTGNGKRLGWFRYQVVLIWRKWLARRSRLRCLNWERMARPPQGISLVASHDHALMATHLERTCQVRNRVRWSTAGRRVLYELSQAPDSSEVYFNKFSKRF